MQWLQRRWWRCLWRQRRRRVGMILQHRCRCYLCNGAVIRRQEQYDACHNKDACTAEAHNSQTERRSLRLLVGVLLGGVALLRAAAVLPVDRFVPSSRARSTGRAWLRWIASLFAPARIVTRLPSSASLARHLAREGPARALVAALSFGDPGLRTVLP